MVKRTLAKAASVLFMSLSLAGCGGVALDRDVEIGKMNFRVPSGYVEDGDSERLSFSDASDDTKSFWVEHFDGTDDSLEDTIDFNVDMWRDVYDFSTNTTNSGVVDGHECVMVECVWPDDFDGFKPAISFAFFSGSEGHYMIASFDESIPAEDVAKTVSFD